MHADRDSQPPAATPPVAEPQPAAGSERERPQRRRLFRGPQTVEAYLRASNPPQYMQRLQQIEAQFQAHRRRLEVAYRALEETCGHDARRFSVRWRAKARAWRFDELNELIRHHNRWYPAEADLPMDPRTRDFVAVGGQSYRRVELGADWILEHFPPTRGEQHQVPKVPRWAPREPL